MSLNRMPSSHIDVCGYTLQGKTNCPIPRRIFQFQKNRICFFFEEKKRIRINLAESFGLFQ
jgi:hypothetical protein